MTSLFIDKLDRFWIRLYKSLFTNIPVPDQSHFQEMLYNMIDLGLEFSFSKLINYGLIHGDGD